MTVPFAQQQPPLDHAPPVPSKRAWVARHKILTGLGALVVVKVSLVAAIGGGGTTSAATDQCSVSVQGTSEITTITGPGASGACANLVADPSRPVSLVQVKMTSVLGARRICHRTDGAKRIQVTATPADPAGQLMCQEISKSTPMTAD